MMQLKTMQKTSSICQTSMEMSLSIENNYNPYFEYFSRCWRREIFRSASARALISSITPRDHSHPHVVSYTQIMNLTIVYPEKKGLSNIFAVSTQKINNNRQDSFFINMNCWIFVTCIVLFLIKVETITTNNRQTYRLSFNQTDSRTIKINQKVRYSFVQTQGSAMLKVASSEGSDIANLSQPLWEGTVNPETEQETLVFNITSLTEVAAGYLQINTIKTVEGLHEHKEKFVHMRKGETRVIEIQPRKKGRLIIERLDGVPFFINNRCSNSQRKECLDEMHRFTAMPLKKHIEVVNLEPCNDCILLLKITTKSPHTRLRLSIEANRTIVQTYPTLSLIKKEQIQHVYVSGKINETGKINVYSGSVQITSPNIQIYRQSNGFNYRIKSHVQGGEDKALIQIKGQNAINYLTIENPSSPDIIALVDGLPATHFIHPNNSYRITYENHNQGKVNIVLYGASQLLGRLSIKFTDLTSKQHYFIRPKVYFNSTIASQSFQLKPLDDSILIELHLISGEGGKISVVSEVNDSISLPLEFTYSSILQYQEYDDYIIEGVSSSVDVIITKCVDCMLKYEISEDTINSTPVKPLENIKITESVALKGNQLFVRVQTNNFAFYSIRVQQNQNKTSKVPYLSSQKIKFYLKEDDESNLLMEFYPPICDQSSCKNTTFYLLEGSDYKHLTSMVYCPFSLFDFEQNTKDIIFEKITPNVEGQLLAYARPLKHRDYIGILAQIGSLILPYKVINTEEVKLYKEMRWPFFYLALFIATAILCTFVIFISLRRKHKAKEEGYIRTSSGSSECIQ